MKQFIFNNVPTRIFDCDTDFTSYKKTIVQDFDVETQSLTDIFEYLQDYTSIPMRYFKIKYGTKTYDFMNKSRILSKIFEDTYEFYVVNVDINANIDTMMFKKHRDTFEKMVTFKEKEYYLEVLISYVISLEPKNTIKEKYFELFSDYSHFMDWSMKTTSQVLKQEYNAICR